MGTAPRSSIDLRTNSAKRHVRSHGADERRLQDERHAREVRLGHVRCLEGGRGPSSLGRPCEERGYSRGSHSGYSAMYIICNLLLVGVVGTFVWSIIAQLLGKPEFPLPEPKPEAIDKAFACISDSGKTYTNKAIGVFYRIAKGHEPALSLKAGAVLYAMAKVSSMFTLLTLAYIATVGAFAGPKIYTLYREDIDMYVDIAKSKVDEVVVQAKG